VFRQVNHQIECSCAHDLRKSGQRDPLIEYVPTSVTGNAHAAQRAAVVTGTLYTGAVARSS
jgi:hypothetical protein